MLIHAYPSPLSVPILQKPRPASLIPNRPAIAPLRAAPCGRILNRLEGSRSAASSDSGSHRKIQRLPLIFRLQQQSQAERLRLTAQRNERGFIPQRASRKSAGTVDQTGSAPSRRRFLRTPAISFAPESGMAMGENDCVSMRARIFLAGDAQRHDPPPLRLQRRITGYRRLRRAQIAPERHAASRQPHCEQDRQPRPCPEG